MPVSSTQETERQTNMSYVVRSYLRKKNNLFFIGLNLQSQFNLENITVFNTNEQESTLGQKVRLIRNLLIEHS